MNAAQVRSKARMAKRRKEEELEQEEMEGGELNLVPYLDIITNIVLFLLASVTTGLVLGAINGNLPEYQQNGGGAPSDPNAQPPLGMIVAVTPQEIQVFSSSGIEGTIAAPKAKIPAVDIGKDPVKDQQVYDQLTKVLEDVVKRNYCATDAQPCDNKNVKPLLGEDDDKQPVCNGNKTDLTGCRPKDAPQLFLMVDGGIPYKEVIGVMDAVRNAPDGLDLFPGIVFSSGIAEQ